MADKKISALTSATTPLAGTEVLPIVQSGSTVKVTVNNLTAGKPVSATFYGAGVASPATVFDAAAGTGADLNLRFSPAGWNTKHRLGVQYTGNGSVWSNNALMSSDTAGNLDDVSNSGSALLLETSGTLKYVTATAGANPRTFTQRFNVNTAGDLTLSTGSLVVGTAGKGIDFSANTHAPGMTSELLDWYEEGTWTPSFTGWSSNPATAAASYTRIGRIVHINALFLSGTTTGGASIGGLPYASGNAIGGAAVSAWTYNDPSTQINGVIINNSTSITNINAATISGLYWVLSVSYAVD